MTALHATDGHLSAVTFTDAAGTSERVRPGRSSSASAAGRTRTGARREGVLTDPAGFIVTGTDLLRDGARPESWPPDRDPLPLETSRAGVSRPATCATARPSASRRAVGEGSMAVVLAYQRLAELGLRI